MNMSRAVTHIKQQLGLYNISLPFRDDITKEPTPTENVIREVLVNTTVPIYSQFVPWDRECDASLQSLMLVDRMQQIYVLPNCITTTPVMYVSDVSLSPISHRGSFGDINMAFGVSRSVKGVMAAQAMNMLIGQARNEPTWEYLGENKIRLYGFPRTVLTFRVACEHEPNGETIPPSCYDSFMELAMLDMKMFLYNTLKMYDQIPTAHGTINLKIEDHQGAEAERGTLLEGWRERFHLDMAWEQFM